LPFALSRIIHPHPAYHQDNKTFTSNSPRHVHYPYPTTIICDLQTNDGLICINFPSHYCFTYEPFMAFRYVTC